MSPEPEAQKRSRPPWVVWALIPVALIILSAVGIWLWDRYDPFVMERPDMRESMALLNTVRTRPLTDEEFDNAIALLSADTPAAQLSAVATIEVDVAHTPSRRDRAIAALEQCPKSAPATRQAASTAATRIKAKKE